LISGSGNLTIVMQPVSQPLVIIVYAPTPEAIPVAERLSTCIGNTQGLDDPELASSIDVLPAAPPGGLVLDWLWTWTKAETDQAAWQQAAGGDPEAARALQSLQAWLPEVLTVASYTDGARDFAAAVCLFDSERTARLLWTGFRWTAGASAKGHVRILGVEALYFEDAGGIVLVFGKGPYIGLLHAPAGATLQDLQSLAETLQL